MFNTKDPWLYLKWGQPWDDFIIDCANPNPHAMRILCLLVSFMVLQGLDSRSNSYHKGKDDTILINVNTLEHVIQGQLRKNQAMIELRAQKHAWKNPFEPTLKQLHVWEISWSLVYAWRSEDPTS